MVTAIFDQDAAEKLLLLNPVLYENVRKTRAGRRGQVDGVDPTHSQNKPLFFMCLSCSSCLPISTDLTLSSGFERSFLQKSLSSICSGRCLSESRDPLCKLSGLCVSKNIIGQHKEKRASLILLIEEITVTI